MFRLLPSFQTGILLLLLSQVGWPKGSGGPDVIHQAFKGPILSESKDEETLVVLSWDIPALHADESFGHQQDIFVAHFEVIRGGEVNWVLLKDTFKI